MRGRGRMVEWSRKCVREKGEERRVKVVIDGRPGLRPLPYSGQGACLCRRLPALPSSIPVFISPSNSPTQYYCTVSVASRMPFILFFSLCSHHCWHHGAHPYLQLSPPKPYYMKPQQFELNSCWKKQKRARFIKLTSFTCLILHIFHIFNIHFIYKTMTKQH